MNSRIDFWWIVFLAGLIPLTLLLIDIQYDRLGENPIQAVHFRLGEWTLRFICLSLAISPLKKITTWKWPLRYRRMIGLFTFFYASLHLLAYLALDQALEWRMIILDILESPYLIMGVITYLVLMPMAITSTKFWQKRLGSNWKKLHRFIYIGSITAVIHYFWQLKGNLAEPLMYAIIIGMLLSFRLLEWHRNNRKVALAQTQAKPLE